MNLTERLTVNGNPLDLAGYSITAPKDGMGLSVSILLAKPDLASIPLDADIKFEIGAKRYNEITEEFDVSYAPPIIEGGKLSGRTYTVRWIQDETGGYPGDVIEFTSLSAIADRWSLVPEFPLAYYNPQLVSADNIKTNAADAIREYGGYEGGYRSLVPTVAPVNDLNLHRVLDLCYVEGCGFERVITNLPNPDIDRVDISIEGGYHEAALALMKKVSLRLLTWEYENILYIYDPSRGLPEIFPVKSLPLDCVVDVVQTISPNVIANSVILSYKQDAGGGYAGEYPKEIIIEDEPFEQGSGESYTRKEGYKRITEYRDLVTDEVRRTLEHEIVSKVYGWKDDIIVTVCALNGSNVYEIYSYGGSAGTVKRNGVVITNGTPNPGTGGEITINDFSFGNIAKGAEAVHRRRVSGGITLISEETLENTYIGNTKAGHVRTLEGVYTDPDLRGRPNYGELLREVNTSTWAGDANHPGESKLVRSVTKLSGLCLRENLNGYAAYTPIQDADEGNLILGDSSQSTEFKDMETLIIEIQETASNQANVVPRLIDHLGGRPRRTTLDGRPGSLSTHIPNFTVAGAKGGVVRELIRDADSVELYGNRKPLSLDVDRLDPAEGRKLAERMLAEAKDPPKSVNINLPGIDFTIRRGSLVLPPYRSSVDGKHIVEAWSVTGTELGDPTRATRRMRLEVTEVRNAAD